jgi:hypothetical protein
LNAGPDMHTWPIVWWAQTGAVVVYCGLCVITARRFHGRVKRGRADWVFWLIIVLIGIRILAPFVFGFGLVYGFAVVLAGVAAAIGILFEINALITDRREQRMQSTKLS